MKIQERFSKILSTLAWLVKDCFWYYDNSLESPNWLKILFLFPLYFCLIRDQGQASNCADLHLKRSTKKYQQSDTDNSMFTVMQEASLIGYIIADIINTIYQLNTRLNVSFKNISNKNVRTCFQYTLTFALVGHYYLQKYDFSLKLSNWFNKYSLGQLQK